MNVNNLYFVATCKRPFGPLLLNELKLKKLLPCDDDYFFDGQ